ncbi:MAG: M6 family metalloprotease domain-containing protein [Desulfobulbaceae bacterium]|nr:M6 family metalloprotease domain-containing protein [Pseudomonadota bacterium]MCG2746988.1 M6 family metalloprotease domain-containing protein [Desulfobulbaceae bacterium]
MSFPFYDEEFTFTQPDGSQIKVRGWGDQHYAVFETLDGFSIVKNPVTGFFEYASLTSDKNDFRPSGVSVGFVDPRYLGLEKNIRVNRESAMAKAMDGYHALGIRRRCEVRRERNKAFLRALMSASGPYAAPPSRTMTGRYVGLCLLIDFPDVPGTITKEEVDDFCNRKGYTGYGNNGSEYDYFYENSIGRLEYTNIITSYYTTKNPRSYYTNPDVPYGARAREMITEALQHLKNQGFYFDQLSTDDEGYVYALNVFYAGARSNAWSEGLWPHSSSLYFRFELNPGRWAYDYQITDIGHELSLATFCHENGHMVCDYPDLYDYGHESNGVGSYCLMSSAGYDRKNPTQICAYLKYKSGWANTVTPITNETQMTLPAGNNDFLLYAKNRREYFLMENRYSKGRDASLPSSGLAIWHIDEVGSNNEESMSEDRHYECSLEQADNQFDLERGNNLGDSKDLFSSVNNNRFSDTTSPSSKWWDGSSSGLDVFDIGMAGEGLMLRAKLYSDIVKTIQKSSSPAQDIPDNDAQGIKDIINVADDAVVSSIKVEVNVTHTYTGDLRITLSAPAGKSVVLHSRAGGGQDNIHEVYDFNNLPELREFVGEGVQGDWVMHVQDLASIDTGALDSWGLSIESVEQGAGATPSVIELDDSPGMRIPDQDPKGIERSLVVDATGYVQEVSVSVDISYTYINDLVVSLVSPAGTSVALHQRTGGSADNILASYDMGTTPGLERLKDEPVSGEWKLKIVDLAWQDVGKHNKWSLRIIRKN